MTSSLGSTLQCTNAGPLWENIFSNFDFVSFTVDILSVKIPYALAIAEKSGFFTSPQEGSFPHVIFWNCETMPKRWLSKTIILIGRLWFAIVANSWILFWLEGYDLL